MSYKQNVSTTVTKTYTLDGSNKHAIREVITANGLTKSKTEWDYDSYGNIVAERRYEDNMTNYVLTAYTYQSNAYMSASKTSGVKDADGTLVTGSPTYAAGEIATKYTYDTLGRLTSLTNPRGNITSYQYNAKNDLTKVTNPDGTMRQYARDYTVNTVVVTDEKGTQIKSTYNQLGQLSTVVDVLTNTVLSSKTYDNLSRLVSETDHVLGSAASYTYDALGRVTTAGAQKSGTLLSQVNYSYSIVGGLYKTTTTKVGEVNAPSVAECAKMRKSITRFKRQFGNLGVNLVKMAGVKGKTVY